MPELPWIKFYPQDWRGDPQLARCSAATRGVWIDAITAMMTANSDRLTGTDAELARDCRCSENEIRTAHLELKKYAVCKATMQNGCKTWVCRRLSRELEIKKIRAEAASKRWSKRDAKVVQANHANGYANSASASASASASLLGKSENPFVPQQPNQEKPLPECVDRPELKEVLDYAQIVGLVEWKARDFFDQMQACGWIDSSRRPVADWKAFMNRVKTWWEADGRPMQPQTRSRSGNHVAPVQALKQIELLIADHPCNPQNPAHGRTKMTTELKTEYANLKERRRELQLAVVKP